MSKKIERELGEISATLKELRYDIEEIRDIAPRVKSLELFRSYVKGGFAVVAALAVAVKGLVNHW